MHSVVLMHLACRSTKSRRSSLYRQARTTLWRRTLLTLQRKRSNHGLEAENKWAQRDNNKFYYFKGSQGETCRDLFRRKHSFFLVSLKFNNVLTRFLWAQALPCAAAVIRFETSERCSVAAAQSWLPCCRSPLLANTSTPPPRPSPRPRRRIASPCPIETRAYPGHRPHRRQSRL